MTLMMIGGVLSWVVCGVLAYGFMFADLQQQVVYLAWPHRLTDRGCATFCGLVGPIGLIAVFFCGAYGHGLRYRGVSKAESRADFERRYSTLLDPGMHGL